MRILIVLIPFLVWLWTWLWALVDAASRDEGTWRRAGESKVMWLLLILVLQFFGTLFYFLMIRPKLIAASDGSGVASR